MPRQLLIMRHAEAAQSFTGDDHSRGLTRHGISQAQDMGAWMMREQLWPDMVVVSDALRTRQTCVWLGEQLGERGSTALHDRRLFEASAAKMCSIINETPQTVETLLIVAHMPAVQELSMALSDLNSDEAAVLSMAEHWPPAGCALFNVTGQWALLDGRDASLEQFQVPAI